MVHVHVSTHEQMEMRRRVAECSRRSGESNYLYHLAFGLFSNTHTFSGITNHPPANRKSLAELQRGAAALLQQDDNTENIPWLLAIYDASSMSVWPATHTGAGVNVGFSSQRGRWKSLVRDHWALPDIMQLFYTVGSLLLSLTQDSKHYVNHSVFTLVFQLIRDDKRKSWCRNVSEYWLNHKWFFEKLCEPGSFDLFSMIGEWNTTVDVVCLKTLLLEVNK